MWAKPFATVIDHLGACAYIKPEKPEMLLDVRLLL